MLQTVERMEEKRVLWLSYCFVGMQMGIGRSFVFVFAFFEKDGNLDVRK